MSLYIGSLLDENTALSETSATVMSAVQSPFNYEVFSAKVPQTIIYAVQSSLTVTYVLQSSLTMMAVVHSSFSQLACSRHLIIVRMYLYLIIIHVLMDNITCLTRDPGIS